MQSAMLVTQGAPKRRPWAVEYNAFSVKTAEPFVCATHKAGC